MTAPDGLPAPINGTEAYLAAILAELRAISRKLDRPEPAAGEPVELREPDVLARKPSRKGTR